VFNILKQVAKTEMASTRIQHNILHTEQKDMKVKRTIHLAQKLILTKYSTLKYRTAGKLEWEQFMCMHVHHFCW
jgi:hypothetical protein